ncbi:hypothetical protein MTMN5_01807 [Marinobacter salarius]|nr:hypothetical protein MTMN5_01807 [Marinobacter salarius]
MIPKEFPMTIWKRVVSHQRGAASDDNREHETIERRLG